MTRFLVAALVVHVASCARAEPPNESASSSAVQFEEEIRIPARLTSIETGELDPLGRPVRIACATCHSLKDVAVMPSSPADLKEMHIGMSFDHGPTSCAGCHVVAPNATPRLRLADGSHIPLEEAMTLCGQCHGPQLRDYRHGAHGGMMGKWDRSLGARQRNHCVDCHDPHVPAIPRSMPAPRAKDRLLSRATEGAR